MSGTVIKRGRSTSGNRVWGWTEQDDQTLRDLIADGKVMNDIARVMGRSRGALDHRVKSLGLSPNTADKRRWTSEEVERMRRMLADGAYDYEVAEALGSGVTGVWSAMTRHGMARNGSAERWTPERIAEANRRTEAGEDIATIAKAMGVTARSVHAKLRPDTPSASGTAVEADSSAGSAKKAGPRPCMCCTQMFDSEGFHNRLCDTCRNLARQMVS